MVWQNIYQNIDYKQNTENGIFCLNKFIVGYPPPSLCPMCLPVQQGLKDGYYPIFLKVNFFLLYILNIAAESSYFGNCVSIYMAGQIQKWANHNFTIDKIGLTVVK